MKIFFAKFAVSNGKIPRGQLVVLKGVLWSVFLYYRTNSYLGLQMIFIWCILMCWTLVKASFATIENIKIVQYAQKTAEKFQILDKEGVGPIVKIDPLVLVTGFPYFKKFSTTKETRSRPRSCIHCISRSRQPACLTIQFASLSFIHARSRSRSSFSVLKFCL